MFKNRFKKLASLALMATLTFSFAGQASARILFQNEVFETDAETLILDFDGESADVTLQFGNDATDGSILWDDSANEFVISDDVNLSGATRLAIPSAASLPGTCTEGDIFYDTTANSLYICTDTGLNTWTASSSDDFESVYTTDGDNTLTASSTFDIDAVGAVGIDSDAGLTLGGAGIGLTSDGGALSLTGDGSADVDLINTGAAIDLDSATFTLDTTAAFSIDGATSSNINLAASTGSTETLTIGATNAGAGAGQIAISTDVWDITGAGVASGFTGLTSTGTVDFSGASSFRMRENSDPATNSACTTLDELIVDTTDNEVQICTVTGIAGAATWVSLSDGGDADTLDGIDSLQFLRADVSDVYGSGAGSETLTIGDGTNGDTLAFAANSIVDFANATINNLDATDVNYDGTTVDAGLGNRLFTEDNVVTDDASFTANIDALDLKWGDLANTTNGEGASLVGIEDVGTYYTGIDVEAALQEIGADLGNNNEQLIFYPEYPDSVVFEDGTNNKGRLASEYDNTNDEHFYNWTSRSGTTQDINIKFRFTLPADFVALAASNAFDFRYRTGSITEADNDVEVRFYNATNGMTLCGSDATNVTAGTWATGTIANTTLNSGCTAGNVLDAGDEIEIAVP